MIPTTSTIKAKFWKLAQRDGFGVPRYSVVAAKGPDHAKELRCIEVAGVAWARAAVQ